MLFALFCVCLALRSPRVVVLRIASFMCVVFYLCVCVVLFHGALIYVRLLWFCFVSLSVWFCVCLVLRSH